MSLDLPEILEGYCNTLGWEFSHGNIANHNLIQGQKEEGVIYFLLDPVTETEASSEFGGDGEVTYTGTFMLLKRSSIDNVYQGQKNQEEGEGKYPKNIKPVKKLELPKIKSNLGCSEFVIELWQVVDTINQLDANLDGVIVTYRLRSTQ